MRNLFGVLVAALLTISDAQAQPREIIVGFSAVNVADDKPAGHAWIILSVKESDGTISIRGYGWAPQIGWSDQSPINKARVLFGAIPGVGGVPASLNQAELLRKGDLYVQKTLNEQQYAAVMDVIDRQIHSDPALTYDGVIYNCIDFTERVAQAAELKIPEVYGTPANFMGQLARLNRENLVPLPGPSDQADFKVSAWWTGVIDQATKFENIQRDLGWRAYQSSHIAKAQADANDVAERRSGEWAANSSQNQAINGAAIGNERSYKDAIRQEHDRITGYGEASSGPVIFGSGGSSTPTKNPACNYPICIFDNGGNTAQLMQSGLDAADLSAARLANNEFRMVDTKSLLSSSSLLSSKQAFLTPRTDGRIGAVLVCGG